MGYTKNAIWGFIGQTSIKVVGNLLVLVKIAVVARILSPTDFGLFSLVVIALGLTEAFTQTGINTTIVQSKQPVSYFLNTAWVIAIIRGLVIGIVMIGMGWAMKYYYHVPSLWSLVAVAALVPVIKGFINPAIIAMYKDLRFLNDSMYRFSLVLVENLAVIALVFTLGSIYGWILALVVTAIFEVIISFIFFSLRPRFQYLSSRAAVIFAQTKVLSISSFLSYLIENGDNLIIGKVVGEYGLGLYQPTYALAHEPNYEVAKSVHHGTLPIYTKIDHDLPRLRRAFIKTSFLTMLAAIGLSLPVFLFPQLVVQIILGNQWLSAVPLLQLLSIAGLLHALALVCYTPLIARNQIKMMNWHMALSFVLMVGLVAVLGQSYGLKGAVLGVVFSRALALPFLGIITLRNIF